MLYFALSMIKIIKIDPRNPEPEKIKEAVKTIQKGGVVVLPTETVYGICTSALDKKAVKRIFNIKNRPLNRPLGIFIDKVTRVKALARGISPLAKRLMKRYWPGPLTLIFERTSQVPNILVAGESTVGIRIPDHPVVLRLLKTAKVPLVQTSANKSGKKAPRTVKEVLKQLGKEKINLILDGGRTRIGKASTVVDMTKHPPAILRKGSLSPFNI